ncbi:hypothetical protein C2E31_14500 [Rhodopirellula baltica]|nr:hypothetical protein C2E31_14500 [Rhodopirellula baltica]
MNLDGKLTVRGVAIDLPNQGVTEIGSAVTIYPGLREKLESDPDFLRNLSPFELDDLAFDFYVAAAATPMSSAEYIEYQRTEAETLRTTIIDLDIENLPDIEGTTEAVTQFRINSLSALQAFASDADAFFSLYLDALTDQGLLRPEDRPPTADGKAENINAFFSVIGGLLGSETGRGIIDDANIGPATAASNMEWFIEQLRALHGHTPDANSGGAVPDFEAFDLGLGNPTSFVTFELRAGPPPLIESGEVADEIAFNLEGLGESVGSDVQLTGPTGFGRDNFVPIATPLPYTAKATYDVDAVDAAREIRVLIPLDDTLDERSFQLADIKLGDLQIPLPAGRPNFVGEFDFTDTEGYVLQVTAGVDATTRVASYLLRAVDGRDGLPPVDPAIGLLQPGQTLTVGFWASANNVEAAGSSDQLATGDLIEMTARWLIDDDAPIDSTTQTAVLDAVAPTSTVSVLPLGGNRYEVQWSSADDQGGSGIATYSLLVSLDGGTRYRSVLYRTDETSFVYKAEEGQSPLFLVRAIDNAGNIEPVPNGVRVPRLVPEINLGSAPSVTIAPTVTLPQATPEPTTVADRLFDEIAFGIPSKTSAAKPSRFNRVIRPLAAESFTTIPGNSGADIGALAMAVGPDGSIYLSGGAGRNELFKIPAGLDPATAQYRLTALPSTSPIYDVVFDASGQLWASTGGQGLLQLDPNTGAVLDRIGAGIALGLAAIPGQTEIYVSTTSGISRFNTSTRKLIPFSDVRADSLAVTRDGVLYGTAWPNGGQILRFDFRGRAETVVQIEGRAESLAIGPVGSLYEDALIVGHESKGSISIVDPLSLRQTVIATGGSGRVEEIQPISGGRFLATQGQQVDVFFTVAAPRVIETRIKDGANQAELVFDVGLLQSNNDPAAGNQRSNYSLKNRDTGETVNIGAVAYDAQSRSASLLFETLSPAEYELTVAAQVESEQGIAIGGNGYTTTFRVFEDVSISTSLAYSNTRLNRADGTLLFDVVVSNTADFDIAGPINVMFDQLGDSSVVFFGNDGAPADANGYQILADGEVLQAHGTSSPQTITIANPNLVDLNFQPRILATLPPNQLPLFSTSPSQFASIDTAYGYDAEADDPDGATVSYVLANAPAGASVNAATGQITWTPGKDAATNVDFELRAYDARGAYKRQTWTVDVSGANRAPIVAPIGDVFATEGDLIEIPVSAFDPDGDDLFYFADRLPPGAVFDWYSQMLRWRPDGSAAGVYEDVTLIASDGFVESSVSFEIVIAANNVAPRLQPIASRTINEGDELTIRLLGEDEDGDNLRYQSSNLPPGSYLDPNTGIFEWTPGFDQHGVYDLKFSVDDGDARTEQTAHIVVNNVNGQVRFSTIDPTEIFEGQTFNLRVAAFDPEFPVAPTSPTTTGDDFYVDFETLLPNLTYQVSGLPSGATFDDDRQLLTWTPGFNDSGQYDITFTATDDGDGTGTSTSDTVVVSINVADANFAPQIESISATTLAVRETLDIPIVATDFEGSALKLDVRFGESTVLPDFATFTDFGDGTGTLSLSPLPGNRDDLLVTVIATELDGPSPLQSQSQFTLQITSENEPPRFKPLYDSVVLVDTTFSLDLVLSDDDQDALTVVASGLPSGSQLIDTGVYGRRKFTWSPTETDIGTYTLTFTATDSGNGDAANQLTDTRTITLTVRNSNIRPTLDPIGEQTVAEGQTLSFTAAAADSDGDTVSFTAGLISGGVAASLPSGASFDGTTGTFNWTPNATQSGTYRIRLTATDGAGSRSEDVFITVTNTNVAPVFSKLPRLYTREGDQLIFSVNAGDADGESLVFDFDGVAPNGFKFDPLSRTVIWDVDYSSAGDFVLPFKVTDPSGASDALNVDVRVLSTNRSPSLTLPSFRQAEIGQLLEIPVLASDPDGDMVTISASDLPAGATLDADHVIRWTAASFQAGTYTVRVTATDGDLAIERPITIVASVEPSGPKLRIVTTPSFPASPGQPITIEPIADSDVELANATLSIDGQIIVLDELGRGTFVSVQPGRFEITATVTDAEGRTTTTKSPLYVRDPADFTAPRIEVLQLAPPIFTESRDLIVNISDAGLAEYKVELIPRGGNGAVLISEGTTSITENIAIDPSLFANGFYTLHITASDFGGLESEYNHEIEINSVSKSGALLEVAVDMTVSLAGIAVPISRVHDSLTMTNAASEFGNKWAFPLFNPQLSLDVGNNDSGQFPAMTDQGRVYLTLPTGERVAFRFEPSSQAIGSVEAFVPGWTSDTSAQWELESPRANLRRAGNSYYEIGSGLPYNPGLVAVGETAFTLISPSGQRHTFERTQSGYKLHSIQAAASEVFLRVTDSALIAPSGERLTIIRNSEGQISELVGPSGEHVVYRYDDVGRLSNVVDLGNSGRTFYGYDAEHRLRTIAVSGAAGTSFSYDDTGVNVSPLQPHLGGTVELLAAPIIGTHQQSPSNYSFTITQGELNSSPSGTITLGIDVDHGTGAINGLVAGTEVAEGDRSVNTFTIETAGTYQLSISGATGEDFTAVIYLAGDVNADGQLDATDSSLLDAALGSDFGDPEYVVQADADRDGTVDELDLAAFRSQFGLQINQAPVYESGEPLLVRTGSQFVVSATEGWADPEGEAFWATVDSATNSTVRALGGGLVLVSPSISQGDISLTLVADDGVLQSAEFNRSIEVLSGGYESLELSQLDPSVRLGQTIKIGVFGILADGTKERLSANDIEFESLTPDLFQVTDLGFVVGSNIGNGALAVSAFGLSTATAINVGGAAREFVDVYPGSYVLRPGEQRPFVVRQRLEQNVVDVTADAETYYVIEDPSVVAIDANGVLTALTVGTTAVTVVRGGKTYQTEFQIAEAKSDTIVGPEGGLIASDDGILVGIPMGALDSTIDISIGAATETDLPFALPPGFSFAGGAELLGIPNQADYPLQVSIPAGPGLSAGDVTYLFREVEVLREGTDPLTTWMIVDVMRVGDDGQMHTTSPPNVGVSGRILDGNNSLFKFSPSGMMFAASPGLFTALGAMSDLSTRISTAGDAQFGDAVVSMDAAIDDATDGSSKFYAANDALGTFLVPAIYSIDYVLTQYKTTPSGLVETANQNVSIQSGTIPNIVLPSVPRSQTRSTPPTVIGAELIPPSNGGSFVVKLEGSEFVMANPYKGVPQLDGSTLGSKVEDLYVTIEIGARDTFNTDGTPLILGGKDIRIPGDKLTLDGDFLSFEVPVGAQVAGTIITVTRPMDLPVDNEFGRQELTSNPVQLLADQRYAMVASGADGAVLIYDICATLTDGEFDLACTVTDPDGDTKLNPFTRASINLVNGQATSTLTPRKTTASPDGARFYVTIDQGMVAVVDTVALQQIDTIPDDDEKPETLGVNTIKLPEGAKAFDLAFAPSGRRLYVSDYRSASVYVIDTDPYSSTYHQTIQTVAFPRTISGVGTVGVIGLRGLAVDSEGNRLFVAAPKQDLFNVRGGTEGVVLSVPLRDEDGNFLSELTFDPGNDEQAVTVVGPGPYELSATDDAGVMLVTDRVADSFGLTVIRKQDEGPWQYETVNFESYGAIPRLVEGRGTQVHGVSNAQGVQYIPANTFEAQIGKHPAYAVVSAYRQFVQGDPKHDPGLGPFFAYNASQTDASGQTQFELIAAGGTIGFIRNPLGNFDDPLTRPRLVAATTPIVNGFTDDIAVSLQSGMVLAPQQAQDIVTGYDLSSMIALIESEATGESVPSWSQIGEDPAADGPLSRLLRGPLSTLPIDRVDPKLADAADFRFHTIDLGGDFALAYGVPNVGPDGESPNKYAPLPGGNLPRGISVQPAASGTLLGLAPTPYNQTPSMLGFPSRPLEVEAGVNAMVEVHSGAVQRSVPLVTYRSLETDRGLVLHYDSLRADPRPIHHLNLTSLDKVTYDTANDRLAYQVTAIGPDGKRYSSDGIDAATAQSQGLQEGYAYFKLPKAQPKETYGVGLQMDLSDAPTGLYTFEVSYGLMRRNGDSYDGRIVSQTSIEAVVNETESPFGGGWNLEGYLRMYPGDAGVLLVDGNGLEHIYLAPQDGSNLYTATVEDYSELRFENNRFYRRLRDGTEQVFDQDGYLESSTDRNGNSTQFIHQDGKLVEITDPVGLTTKLVYSGDYLTSVVDPINRTTRIDNTDGNLVEIVHPDGAKLSFQYEYVHQDDPEIGDHLMTGQTLPRGNDNTDPLSGSFKETYEYNDVNGRFESGTRVDSKTTTLTAAQVMFLADPEKISDPTQAEELHVLSSPATAELSEDLVSQCGGDPPESSAVRYTASAMHTDFKGTRREFKMTNFGQYHDSRDDARQTKQVGRGLNAGRVLVEKDAVGNLTCYVRDFLGNVVSQTDYPDGSPATQTIAYDYDPEFSYSESYNIPVKIIDAVGRETLHSLDSKGNILRTTISDPHAPAGSPTQTIQQYTYDSGHGYLPDVATDALGNQIDRNYNSQG